MILPKSKINTFYLDDPKSGPIERELDNTIMKYFYFSKKIKKFREFYITAEINSDL